ncbi:unnamed protein product [Rotaria socialis]
MQPSETTRIEINISEFSRGEVTVKLRRDNTLLVHALHLDQFATDNFFRKELVKTFPIPLGADVDKIRSVIRNTGILTIDIPMLRVNDAIKHLHEELLETVDQPVRQTTRSYSCGDVLKSNLQTTRRPPPITVPKQTANFLQSDFHPTFTPNGKKIILKIDTRGYEADELSVRLVDYTLLVQGRKKFILHTIKNEDKQFSQCIRLPDGIDKYNVSSHVMENGVLVIDIPLLNSVLY